MATLPRRSVLTGSAAGIAALFVSRGGEVHAVPLHQAPLLDAAAVPK